MDIRHTRLTAAWLPLVAHRLVILLLVAATVPGAALADTVISGTVSDRVSGAPIAGALVEIRFNQFPNSAATTDSNGNYSISASIFPGPNDVVSFDAQADHYLSSNGIFDGTPPQVRLDIPLDKASTITGTVHFPGGGAVPPNAFITMGTSSNGVWNDRYSVIPGNGTFVVESGPGTLRLCAGGISVGTLVQCFDHADQESSGAPLEFSPVVVQLHQDQAGIDFDLVAGGSISGHLIDGHNSTPIARYSVTLRFFDPSGSFIDDAPIISDDAGYYRASGIPNGSFRLQVIAVGPFTDEVQTYPGIPCAKDCDPSHGQLLTISGLDALEDVDFTFHPQALIRGRILDSTSGQGIGGATINGYTKRTDIFGGVSYEIEWSAVSNAPDGSYELSARATNDGYQHYLSSEDAPPHVNAVYPGTNCVRTQSCVPESPPILVHTGETVDHMDISMQLGASIEGRIFDTRSGMPVPGWVTLLDKDDHDLSDAYSAADGTYRLPAVPAGVYFAKALSYNFVCGVYENKACPAFQDPIASVDPTPIVLQAGQMREGIDFRLDADTIFADGLEQASPAANVRPATRDR